MSRGPPASSEPSIDAAVRELARLRADGDEARAKLAALEKAVEAAESRLKAADASQLQEANERLVLSNLKARVHAEYCVSELDRITRSAELDVLTSLPNRVVLLDRFGHAIAAAKRNGTRLALLFVDLNQFKNINDTLGHAAGDNVLKQAAHRLTDAVREVDTVSRHGGDEFLVLLTDIATAAEAGRVAEKLVSALAAPSKIGDHVLRLTASIGVSIYPDDGDTPALLIDRADAAMYVAKRKGTLDVVFHNSDLALGQASPPGLASLAKPLAHYDEARENQGRMNDELLEANGALVRAAIDAQHLQASAELSQRRQKEYLALVAHELRNPLAPLSIATSLLKGADAVCQNEMQDIIERQVTHMSRLIGDLLDLSRGETGKLRIYPREVDLVAIVDDAIRATRPGMDTRLQRFNVVLPKQPLQLIADPIRLVQILSNLLDNASKYTPRGGDIRLVVAQHDDDVVISVDDNGIGVSLEALSVVFEPFAQEPHATGFSGTGLGIGLTVVRELVQSHGGSVVAISEGAGHGSQFVVTLPLAGPVVPSDVEPA